MQKAEKTALIYATDLLARQDYSETRLRQKLALRKYSESEIDEAVEKLKKYNYLNDETACAYQFELMYQSNKYSVQQICAKLFKFGFETQLIEKCKPKDYEEHDERVAILMLCSKFKTLPENKKLWQFLSTKGFDYSTISAAVDEFKNNFAKD